VTLQGLEGRLPAASARSPYSPHEIIYRAAHLRKPAHRHSLNNQYELESSDVVPGQGTCANAQGRLGQVSTGGNEKEAGEPFSTGCRFLYCPGRGQSYCDDHDIPVSVRRQAVVA
jgi:hypothetical protein